MKQIKIMAIILLSIFLGTGCAKKREEHFAQGQGENLSQISSMDGETFSLMTSEDLAETNSSRFDSVSITGDESELNHFNLVSYSTDAKLLGDVPLRARKNHRYEIRYVLSSQYLKVYKVGIRKDIPFQEHPYAETLEDGRLGVPMVGYTVQGTYRLEKQKNSDNEETNLIIEVAETDLSKATHFRIDPNSRVIFEALKKIDIFPSKMLEGEWFFSETVIGTNEESSSEIGSAMGVDAKFERATRIRFQKSERLLRGVNVNIDTRADASNDLNYSSVIMLPVEWKDFRAAPGTGGPSLHEEITEDKRWSDRPYAEIHFEDTTTMLNDGFGNRLLDLEITPDYLSYTVLKDAEGVRVKYAFLRAKERHYEPKRYSYSDFKRFGFFQANRQMIMNYELYRREDFEQAQTLARFNPKTRTIIYHFVKGTSEFLRVPARKAIAEWDLAFGKADTGMHVVLDESFDVTLGDLRYNTLNFVQTLSDEGRLGYGPSVIDSTSGEIISATANIYVTPTIDTFVGSLRSLILLRLGLVDGSQILNINPSTYKSVMVPSESSNDYDSITNKKEFRTELSETKCELNKDATFHGSMSEQEVEQLCPDFLSYIDDIKSKAITHDERELPLLKSCAMRLAQKDIVFSTGHELGHNFGLMHNFFGSTDSANFYSKEETGTSQIVEGSSIMDYPDLSRPHLFKPGSYDIAAIRFGYSNQIELENGRLLTLDPSISIAENLEKEGAQDRSYKFCMDMHVYYSTDPMCERHDSGTKPIDVVTRNIEKYWDTYNLRHRRFDRRMIAPQHRVALMSRHIYFETLKRFYDQWRFHLSRFVGQDGRYLEKLNSKSFQTLLAKMEADPEYSLIYREWRPVAEKVYEFLKQVAFMPNRYCIVERRGTRDAIELEKLRQDLFQATGKSAQNCSSPLITSRLKKMGMSLIDETGYSFNDMRFSLGDDDLDLPLDVIGSELTRLAAFQTLVERSVDSPLHMNHNLVPNLLDEPDFRNDIYKTLHARIIDGVTLEDYGVKNRPRFTTEKKLIARFVSDFQKGLMIPGKPKANRERLEPFKAYETQLPREVQNAVSTLQVGSTFIAAMTEENIFVTDLIEAYMSVSERTNEPEPDAQSMQLFRDAIVSLPQQNSTYTPARKAWNPSQPMPSLTSTVLVGDFLNKAQGLLKMLGEHPSAFASRRFAEKYSGTLEQTEQLFVWLSNFYKELDTQEKRDQFLQEHMESILIGNGGPKAINPLYKEAFRDTFMELEDVLSMISDEQSKLWVETEANREDYEGQLDLILQSLL